MMRCVEHRRRLGLGRRRIVEERGDERFLLRLLDFKMEGRIGAARRLTGFRMTPAHHGGIEAFFENLADAGFEHGLAAQNRRTMRLVFEISLKPIGLFGGEQTRFRMRMPELQPDASGEQILDRESPIGCECFYPLSRHSVYTIRPLSFYPVGV